MNSEPDIERAITTLQIVLSGGRLTNPDDLTTALAVVGHTTSALFAELVRLDQRDVAVSYIEQLRTMLSQFGA